MLLKAWRNAIPALALSLTFLASEATGAPAESPQSTEPSDSYEASTTKTKDGKEGADIPVAQLELLLLPLTKDELVVEADAWLELLKAKVREISVRKIALAKQKEQLRKVEEAADAADEAKEAKEEASEALREALETGSADAAEEAREAAKEAEEKEAAATKATEEAEKTEAEALKDEETAAAAQEAAKRAEAEAKEEAEEEAAEAKEEEAEAKEAEAAERSGTAPPKETPAPAGEAPPGAPAPVEAAPGEAPPPAEPPAPAVRATDAKDPDKLKEAAEKKAEVRTTLLATITELESERTALIDRLNLVLDELEGKSSEEDVAAYRKYIKAVSGITVDVSEWSAAWTTISGWLKSDEGGIRWGGNLLQFAGTVFGFGVLALILGRLVDRATRRSRRISGLLGDFLSKSVRRVVFIVGVIIGLAALEINVGPVLAVIGAAGFVVAFALQGTLSNFASGILILLYRPFDVGDVVEAGGVSGVVESMNLLSTRIKTFDNKAMIVPNNGIWNGVITNVTGTTQRRVDMVFGIGYESDIEKAQSILEDIVKSHELVLKVPEPVIKLHELADSSVNFVVRPWARTSDYWNVYWDVTRAVKQRFDQEGISIPFPQRDVHVYHETPEPEAKS